MPAAGRARAPDPAGERDLGRALRAPTPAPATAPTAPPSTKTPAAPAHLRVSPDHASFAPEKLHTPRDAQTFTVTNDGGSASGEISLDGDVDQPGDDRVHSDFEVEDDLCTRRRLASGEQCTFTLVLVARSFGSGGPWSGDLVVNAAPGGPAPITVTARYSSDLVFDPVDELVAGPTPPTAGVDHFVVTNDGPVAVGPLHWRFLTFGRAGAQGSFTSVPDPTDGITPCADGITLAPGGSCGWVITYTNPTGGGANHATLILDGPGAVHAEAAFRGVGLPTT